MLTKAPQSLPLFANVDIKGCIQHKDVILTSIGITMKFTLSAEHDLKPPG